MLKGCFLCTLTSGACCRPAFSDVILPLCSVNEVRKHPPDAMEEPLPGLRVVSAEIETPAGSPREDGASPLAAKSGDSLGRVLRTQAARLKHAVMSQKVPPYSKPRHQSKSTALGHSVQPYSLSMTGGCSGLLRMPVPLTLGLGGCVNAELAK